MMESTSTSSNLQTHQSATQLDEGVTDTERWGSLITGGAMILKGLSQRSLRGVLLAIAAPNNLAVKPQECGAV